jgi:hydrogen peroxide-dependent heme synthase
MTDGDTTVFAFFWLYRVSPEWRRLEAFEREHQRDEFAQVLAAHSGSLALRGAYSLAGLRHDADLMLWLYGPDLGAAQDLAVALRKTGLGTYLENTYTYTGIVPISRYAPEHRPAFVQGRSPLRYLSMYPFVKTPEWYLLPFERRRALMAEHGRMGQRHSAIPEAVIEEASAGAAVAVAAPSHGAVLANTVHSFGLGDQEFVVAFESDDPAAIARMVEDLRAAEVRRYTAVDTPIFLGRRKDLRATLDDLG